MEVLRQLVSRDKHITSFLQEIQSGQTASQLITGLTGSARPVMVDALFEYVKKPIYIVSPNLLQAQRMVDELAGLLGEENVHYYPADEFIAADLSVASPELRAERIATLDCLARGEGCLRDPCCRFKEDHAAEGTLATLFFTNNCGR